MKLEGKTLKRGMKVWLKRDKVGQGQSQLLKRWGMQSFLFEEEEIIPSFALWDYHFPARRFKRRIIPATPSGNIWVRSATTGRLHKWKKNRITLTPPLFPLIDSFIKDSEKSDRIGV